MNIYVGNLSYKLTEQALMTAFAEFGTVNSVKIISDRETGKPKGFAFVVMDNNSEAKSAIEALDGKELDGRSMRVNEAKPRPERSERSERSDRPRPRTGGNNRGPRY